MANSLGFARDVLRQIAQVTENNTPSKKVTASGYLQMLLASKARISNLQDILAGDDGSGHLKDVKIKYIPRSVPGDVQTSDNCDIDVVPAYSEIAVDRTLFRKKGLYISMDTMARYMNDASKTVAVGKPPTTLMMEFYDQMINEMNGLIGAIDIALLDKQAITFGKNVVSGNNAAQTVNIPLLNTNNDLSTGLTKILADASVNEFNGVLDIVGSGLFNAYQLQQAYKTANQAGVDTSKITGYNFFHDLYSGSRWGTNQVGAFARGSVQLIDINRYVGFRAGHIGTSFFFTIPVPVEVANGQYSNLVFDAQLKELDCPTEVTITGYGSPATVSAGYMLFLSKAFDQFNEPNEAYKNSDRLYVNNGTLRYAITNS